MADITVPTAPPLATVRGVELMHAGQWDALSGRETFTVDDFTSAVAALDCPAVRRPVLKFGHDGNHGAGMPALGYIGNMATRHSGRTLAGDYIGMPGWLATVDADGNSVLSSAYPDRSIEGEYDYRCQIGHSHPFVIHAVALLGVERPGVGTLPSLQDLATLYGVAASSPEPTGTPVTLTVRAAVGDPDDAEPEHTGAMIALVPTAVDAERLAVDGGEPAGQLHATMFYLGEGDDFDQAARDNLIARLTDTAAALAPVEGDGFAINVFNPGSDDKDTAIVLGVGGQPVDDAHTAVLVAVDGYDLPEQHAPFVPHVTLIYSDDLALVEQFVDRTGPVTFDRLRVAFAGAMTDIPLASPVTATARSSPMPNPKPTEVAAGVTTEDVRRAYYNVAPWSVWICEMQLDPALQLIVTDDDDGSYSRVAVLIDGDDVTFADPVKVAVTYVDKPEPNQAAASAPRRTVAYASRAESRPGARPTASDTETPTEPPAPDNPHTPSLPSPPPVPGTEPPDEDTPEPPAEPETPPIQEDRMSLSPEARELLGLGEDADDAAVSAAIVSAVDKATAPTTETAPVAASLPEGVVTIDQETLAGLRRDAQAGAEARARQVTEDRDREIQAAVSAGKISPARVEHWTKAYDADPDGIKAALASLAEGVMVPVATAGVTGAAEPDGETEGQYDDMFSRPAVTTSKEA